MKTLFYLPNFIKIDPYNFELYRFKVGAFFETQCIQRRQAAVAVSSTVTQNGLRQRRRIYKANLFEWGNVYL